MARGATQGGSQAAADAAVAEDVQVCLACACLLACFLFASGCLGLRALRTPGAHLQTNTVLLASRHVTATACTV